MEQLMMQSPQSLSPTIIQTQTHPPIKYRLTPSPIKKPQHLILEKDSQFFSPRKSQMAKIQGFEQTDEALKLVPSLSVKQTTILDSFYKIPEAKPLLSKQFIDFAKPKVLIKEVPIYKEPDELIAYNITQLPSQSTFNHSPMERSTSQKFSTIVSKGSLKLKQDIDQGLSSPQEDKQKQETNEDRTPVTLWQKYLSTKSNYQVVYLKYLRESSKEDLLQSKSMDDQERKEGKKRLKQDLLRMCRNDENLFNTYFIDLEFLTDAGSTLLRNLQDSKLSAVYVKWQQSLQQLLNAQKQAEDNHRNLKSEAEDNLISNPPGQIQFESRFESGNLFGAFRKVERRTGKPQDSRAYDLVLQNDINTKGYANWFYFSIRSQVKGRIRLNIVNMHKDYSLFTNGMKVVIFSYQRWQREQVEWHHSGHSFTYRKNEIVKSSENPSQRYNTLSFTLEQKYDNDIIYVAASIPYSYSRLLSLLSNVEKVAKLNSNIYFKKESHISTISSNLVPIITLTWKRDTTKNHKINPKKKIIAIIARQHPCETVSSWVMEGLINSLVYLTNENSVELLKKYIFKIIPMFNVDGVIYGNSRCDISGSDTNRKWTPKPNSFLYPVTHNSKKLFSQLINEGYDIEYFIDLHGHSKKLGTFVYACKTMDEIETRMLSWLMGKVCNKFSWENCIFGLAKTKVQTARGSMAQLVQGKKAITLETSFFGWKKFGSPPKHFDTKDLHEIGENLLTAIYIEQGRDPKLYNWANIRNEIRSIIENNQAKQDDYESGSDSCPSEDQMTFQEKVSSFLPSTVATKIGLVEIKVVEKSRPKDRLPIVESAPPEEEPNAFGGFEHPQTESLASLELSPFQSYFSNKLSSSTLPKSLSHSKSVTKVSPFKFTERNRQSFSTKKIKIAIDVRFVLENKEKMSVPSLLPQIQQSGRKQGSKKKKNFWVDFHHEYEKLVKEKEKLVLEKDLKKNFNAKDISKPLLGIKAYK